MQKEELRGIVLVSAAAILWSTGGVGIKLIEAPGPAIALLRAVVTTFIFLPFFRPLKPSWKLLGLLLSYTLLSLCFATATRLTAAANAIALQFTAPIWLFLYRIITTRKAPSFKETLPILFIISGIGFFLTEEGTQGQMLGNIIAVFSGIAFAANTLFFRLLKDEDSASLIFCCNLFMSATLLPFFIFFFDFRPIIESSWPILIYLGGVQMGLSFFCFSRSLRYIEPLTASITILLEPIFNPILVFIFIHEIPSQNAVLGGIFILPALFIHLYQKERESRKVHYSPS